MPNYTQALDDYLLQNPEFVEEVPRIALELRIEAARMELRACLEDMNAENIEL
jgi:uncharacterized protein YigA (DUF484 family)